MFARNGGVMLVGLGNGNKEDGKFIWVHRGIGLAPAVNIYEKNREIKFSEFIGFWRGELAAGREYEEGWLEDRIFGGFDY